MDIKKESVVYISFTSKDENGDVMDEISKSNPLPFIFGRNQIIPGLESKLEGKIEGDEISVVLKPEEAFGDYNKDLVKELALDAFDEVEDIEVGSEIELEVETEDEDVVALGRVLEISDTNVVVDLNHPLAGKTLHYDVQVVAVREQTAEEIDLGTIKEFFPT
ncbi:MAG: peptidylprolyl isomerase [Candidatus Margulisiibacteriota bacterium]|nr:peptidylprolyl isomerase [Candidatus Margulisiibacteriota bacterium]